MKFELDKILIDNILFHMENQEDSFFLDTQKVQIVKDANFEDEERFVPLPEWKAKDGYRLMEVFTLNLKNPIARGELTDALNEKKGVFRKFKNVLDQYPQIEKLWLKHKEQKMKGEIIAWYNSLREEWGLEPVGAEPEDTSFLVLEDFIIKELESTDAISFSAENANGEKVGFICASKQKEGFSVIKFEVEAEYRGMGLGKILLSKLTEKTSGQTITIDLPSESNFFSRILAQEGFKPSMQRFVRI